MIPTSFTATIPGTSSSLLSSEGRPVTREYFLRFIQVNPELRTELTAEGEMIIMAPAYSSSGHQNADLSYQLVRWAKRDGNGQAYDSSAGFNLPNGSIRSPDTSWVLKSRLLELTKQQRSGFLPLCPDFVVELRSKTDTVQMLGLKMTEYLGNGARLGFLIDPFKRTVHIYRPQQHVIFLENPIEVSASPELPGFVLDLRPIFDPEF